MCCPAYLTHSPIGGGLGFQSRHLVRGTVLKAEWVIVIMSVFIVSGPQNPLDGGTDRFRINDISIS